MIKWDNFVDQKSELKRRCRKAGKGTEKEHKVSKDCDSAIWEGAERPGFVQTLEKKA